METAGVAELTARLSEYLDRVKAGEEVIITEGGRAIARVVPIEQRGPSDEDMEELYRTGLVRPGKRRGLPPDFWTRERVQDPEGSVRQALLADREEGW